MVINKQTVGKIPETSGSDDTWLLRLYVAGQTGNGKTSHLLRLYVSGMTPRSIEALANIRRICEKHLKNRYELEVVDTFQKPHQLKEDQIVAMPTLLKKLPAPLRRIVGDLSDTERVLLALDLIKKA